MQFSPLETHELENGLKVAVAPSPSPGVAVNLWYEVGSVDEHPSKTGFAHLFEHLMFQGSANVAPGQHMAEIEAVGGTVNATTSADRTNYYETVPRSALELALWLEADRLSSLSITPENFEAQRQVVKEEKRQRYDNVPYGDLLQLLTSQHFPADHPYGHLTIGSMEHLDAAQLTDVSEFFQTWYRPSNATLVLVGPVTPDEGFSLVERYFAHLPKLPPRNPVTDSTIPLVPPHTNVVRRSVPYPIVYLSWPTVPAHNPSQIAIEIALAILADGNASRMHKQLVKESRLAQETHTYSMPNRSAASLAVIGARPAAGVSAEDTSQAILDVVAQFVEEGPTEAEFERAVAQYERSWLWQLATAEDRADAINESWLVHGDPRRADTHLQDVLALTAGDVRSAAKRWLVPEQAHQLHYLTEEA